MDDNTRETKLYFQLKKSETIDSYKRDEAYIETQSRNHIKFSRSDRGGEFLSKELIQHQDDKGTQRELTVHDSPPQNGSAERGMRTCAERARALLLGSGLPRFLWEEAMKHVAWLQNRTPSCTINRKTPYKMHHGKKPNMAGIQEFGAAAYVKDLDAGKLDARAQVGRFVGYDFKSKGYRIYWPNKHSISVERNVVFNENDVLTNNDTVVIPGDILAEGERDKIIQNPENATTGDLKGQIEPKAEDPETSEPSDLLNPVKPTTNQDPTKILESLDEKPLGRRARLPPGAYKKLNDGENPLAVNIVTIKDVEEEAKPNHQFSFDDSDEFLDLPFNFFTLHTTLSSICEHIRKCSLCMIILNHLGVVISQLQIIGIDIRALLAVTTIRLRPIIPSMTRSVALAVCKGVADSHYS